MKYPNNTPHVEGLWFMPDDTDDCLHLLFKNTEEFRWISKFSFYHHDEEDFYYVLLDPLKQSRWDEKVEKKGDNYFDSRASFLLPLKFMYGESGETS